MKRLHRHLSIQLGHLPPDVDAFRLRHSFEAPLVVLESRGSHPSARWSYLCADPFLVFRSRRGRVTVGPPGAERLVEGAPLDVLSELLRTHRPEEHAWRPGLPPLLGGAVGYLGYELLREIEPSVAARECEPSESVPEVLLLFCGSTVALDSQTGQSWLITQAYDETPTLAERQASERMERLVARVGAPLPAPLDPTRLRHIVASRRAAHPRLDLESAHRVGLEARTSREAYLEMIRRVQGHIAAGDVYEVCTAHRFDARAPVPEAARLYEVLRAVNPAPFSGYLNLPGEHGESLEVMSSSPERMLRLDREGRVETRPIKGTRPRGATTEEDEILRRELSTSEKDRAENAMIVDLARNDLGRVCRFGTVRTPALMVVEEHPFTFQLVSTISGQLRDAVGPVELIRAAFPGGSMTGAPKVRAMQLIRELEPVARGVFSGCIGFIDFEGAMDLSIVIRSFVKHGEALSFHVGGAIVADSDPREEHQETLDKAHAMVLAYELTRLLEVAPEAP